MNYLYSHRGDHQITVKNATVPIHKSVGIWYNFRLLSADLTGYSAPIVEKYVAIGYGLPLELKSPQEMREFVLLCMDVNDNNLATIVLKNSNLNKSFPSTTIAIEGGSYWKSLKTLTPDVEIVTRDAHFRVHSEILQQFFPDYKIQDGLVCAEDHTHEEILSKYK